VVKLESAPGLTRIDSGGAAHGAVEAGFSSVMYRLKHRPAKELVESFKAVLSKPAGSVVSLGEDVLLVTDLAPRVEQTLALLETMDVPGEAVEVNEVPAANLGAQQLAALAAQVVAKRDTVAGAKEKGEVVPGPDGRSVLVIAPHSSQEFWRGLLAALDKREPVLTATYTARYFDLKEVQKLIEQTVKPAGGGEDRWRIVPDDLSGSLIVTATAGQHEQVASLLTRLNSVPPEGRRPMRIFKVHNRDVNSILGVLQNLVASGELADLSDAPGSSAPPPPPGSQYTPTPVTPSPSIAPGTRTDLPARTDAPPPPPAPATPTLGGTTPGRHEGSSRSGQLFGAERRQDSAGCAADGR
jgi:hypothetical protein